MSDLEEGLKEAELLSHEISKLIAGRKTSTAVMALAAIVASLAEMAGDKKTELLSLFNRCLTVGERQ